MCLSWVFTVMCITARHLPFVSFIYYQRKRLLNESSQPVTLLVLSLKSLFYAVKLQNCRVSGIIVDNTKLKVWIDCSVINFKYRRQEDSYDDQKRTECRFIFILVATLMMATIKWIIQLIKPKSQQVFLLRSYLLS